MYKIQIDQSLCSGFGTCAELAPEIFELDGSGTATVRRGESDDPDRARSGRGLPDGRDHRLSGGSGMTTPRTILIVGAGLAGARCAETLRAEGYRRRARARRRGAARAVRAPGPLEGVPRRQARPRGHDSSPRVVLERAADRPCASARGSSRSTGTRRRRRTGDGAELAWDALVLATGAARPAAAIPDSRPACTSCGRRPTRSRSAKSSSRERVSVIVGGGFVGAEVASTAIELGRRR